MVTVDKEICKFCGKCLTKCGFEAIEYDRDKKEISLNENCIGCRLCIEICPFGALFQQSIVPKKIFDNYKGVVVWAELEERDGHFHVREVTYELLSKAKELALELKEKLILIMVGDFLKEYSFADYGVNEVYICDNSLLKKYTVEAYTKAIVTIVEQIKPSIFLLPATNKGRAIAPRIAARLKTGLTADCTELTIGENRELYQIRPAFGGNIMATIKTPNHRPQIATVRPNTFSIKTTKKIAPPHIIKKNITLEAQDFLTEVIQNIQEESDSIDIEEASVLVAVGKGIGSKENIQVAQELALKLGGVVVGSRAVVEMGWLDHCRQVGQSGRTVSPKLYIAMGISGAMQHIVGMSSSEKIVAINNDPTASIFNYADVGIVGDYKEVCETLLRKLNSADKLSSLL